MPFKIIFPEMLAAVALVASATAGAFEVAAVVLAGIAFEVSFRGADD